MNIIENHRRDIEKWGWFKDHEATLVSPTHLRWRKPGTSIYFVEFIVHGSHLIVLGDIDEAIYQWSDRVTFGWIAGLDTQYFAGKCQASEYGRGNRCWHPELAVEVIQNFAKERREELKPPDDPETDECDTEREERERKLSELELDEVDAIAAVSSEGEYHQWLGENGFDFFGESWTEYGGIGKAVSLRAVGHLMGLQLAVKQLRDKGVQID